MKKLSALMAIGIGSYIISMIVFAGPQVASAADRRVHSSICHYYYDDAGSGLYNGAYLSVGNTARGIFCPALSDTILPHAATNILNVHGYASSTATYSRACAKAFNSAAVSCGTSKNWPVGYTGVYNVDTSRWIAEPGSMPYIYTYMAANSALYGYYMSN